LLQSKLSPQELVPLANPYPDFHVSPDGLGLTRGQHCPGWGEHQGWMKHDK